MKTIFFGEAASDSGSFGFSEAWPLDILVSQTRKSGNRGQNSPSCPHSVDVHTLCNIDNELDVGIVVVVGTSRNLRPSVSHAHNSQHLPECATHLNILIRHADVLSVGLEILGRRHDGELNRPLIAEGLVCPFPHRADFLDCCNTVICNEHLRSTTVSTRPSSTAKTTQNSWKWAFSHL